MKSKYYGKRTKMNAITIYLSAYSFVDYYFDQSETKIYKLVLFCLTIPTTLLYLIKLVRMGWYAIPYVLINTLNVVTLGSVNHFYELNYSAYNPILTAHHRIKWNFVNVTYTESQMYDDLDIYHMYEIDQMNVSKWNKIASQLKKTKFSCEWQGLFQSHLDRHDKIYNRFKLFIIHYFIYHDEGVIKLNELKCFIKFKNISQKLDKIMYLSENEYIRNDISKIESFIKNNKTVNLAYSIEDNCDLIKMKHFHNDKFKFKICFNKYDENTDIYEKVEDAGTITYPVYRKLRYMKEKISHVCEFYICEDLYLCTDLLFRDIENNYIIILPVSLKDEGYSPFTPSHKKRELIGYLHKIYQTELGYETFISI